jgi:hypothetical protein
MAQRIGCLGSEDMQRDQWHVPTQTISFEDHTLLCSINTRLETLISFLAIEHVEIRFVKPLRRPKDQGARVSEVIKVGG